MEQNREQLQQEIAVTAQSLRNKIEQLEETTLQTVQNVTDGVKQTAETIQEGFQSLSISHQMKKNPGAVIATSVGVGAILGMRSGRRSHAGPRRPSIAGAMTKVLFLEASRAVAPALLGIGVGIASEWAKKRYPKAKDTLSLIETLVTGRA